MICAKIKDVQKYKEWLTNLQVNLCCNAFLFLNVVLQLIDIFSYQYLPLWGVLLHYYWVYYYYYYYYYSKRIIALRSIFAICIGSNHRMHFSVFIQSTPYSKMAALLLFFNFQFSPFASFLIKLKIQTEKIWLECGTKAAFESQHRPYS